MDDNWDIEYDIHIKNSIDDVAKYKVGDIVHTWVDGKCVSGVVRTRYTIDIDNNSIRYNIAVTDGALLNVHEDALIKTGHINVDVSSVSVLDFW